MLLSDNAPAIGGKTVAVPDILPYPTRRQLDFICSFLYALTVIESGKKRTLADAVNALYRKIDLSGVDIIHQPGLRGMGQIEYVRKYDMMNLLYRLRCIGFHSKIY